MTARMFRAWFDVGPPSKYTPEGQKFASLTMRHDSPFYVKEAWVDRYGQELVLTVYTCLPDNFEEQARKETGLKIMEHDTDFVLQFLVDFDKPPSQAQLAKVHRKLERFVTRHFKLYVPNTQTQQE